jgi:dihydroflavonol-4-reductase
MVNVAVTGVTGMIGGAVGRCFAESGHTVRGVARSASRTAGLPFDVVTAAMNDVASLRAALTDCEIVVHCAAVYAYGAQNHAEVSSVNVDGTRTLMEAAKDAGVRRLVITSSSVTAGSSLDGSVHDERHSIGNEYSPPYFHSKVRQERAALQMAGSDLEVVIACPTVVMGGPSSRLVPSNAIVLRYLLDFFRSTFPGGCNVVSLDDVARAHLMLAEKGVPGERYLVGSENLSWRTLHSLIADLGGIAGPRFEIPTAAAYLTSAAAEAWSRFAETEPLSTREEALTIGRFYWYGHDKIAALGYAPQPARAAVASALAWLMASAHVPRWVREGMRPMPEVRASRPLIPRPL